MREEGRADETLSIDVSFVFGIGTILDGDLRSATRESMFA